MILGENDLNNILLKYPNEFILLIFSAPWCGPCKKLKEKLSDTEDEFVKDLQSLKYIIIDITKEENDNLCNFYKVKNIPHQVFIKLIENKNGDYDIKIYDTLIGYDLVGLVTKYKKLIL